LVIQTATSTVNLQIHGLTTSNYFHDRLRPLRSLASKVPSVQVPAASTEVAGESQPAQVRNKSVTRRLVNLAPDVNQPASDTGESHDIGSRFDRAAEAEEQRHPDQVQAELDGVESGAVPGQGDGRGVGAGGAYGPGAVGSVAHEAVEDCPGGTEDPSWWASGAVEVSLVVGDVDGLVSIYCEVLAGLEGNNGWEDSTNRLLQCGILLLRAYSCGEVRILTDALVECVSSLR
jgi:hypothetical protein